MTLEDFKDTWLSNWQISKGLDIGIVDYGNILGTVLYREGQYQVELFIVKPNTEVISHTHPNVDSYEIYLSGDISFMSNNIWYNQKITAKRRQLKISSDTIHAAKFGNAGGTFLSIQCWKGMMPDRVGNNWIDNYGNTSAVCSTIK